MIAAVTFDYWNTLAFESPAGLLLERRMDAMTGYLRGAGHDIPRETLQAGMRSAWEAFVAAWEANRPFSYEDAISTAVASLPVSLNEGQRDELAAVCVGSASGVDLGLADGAAETLRELKARGIRLGIVCDVGFTPSPLLRDFLDRKGLLELFDAWAFSDEVGCYKPDARIFRHALDGLGVEPADAAHVGDLRRTDIAGARAMGMRAVRYRGLNDDADERGPEGHAVVSHHAELIAALEVPA